MEAASAQEEPVPDVPLTPLHPGERPAQDAAAIIGRLRDGLRNLEELLEALEDTLSVESPVASEPGPTVNAISTAPEPATRSAELADAPSLDEPAAEAPRKADSAAGLAWWLSPELPAFDGDHVDQHAEGESAPAVEEPRAIETPEPPAPEPAKPAEDAASAREEVRLQVERLKAEIAAGLLGGDEDASDEEGAAATETASDDEDVREKVRLEVERAKAELLGEGAEKEAPRSLPAGSFGLAEAGWTSPATEAWQARTLESADAPAVMPLFVVDDAEGRVQLARVYEALGRLGCAGEASLVNYTPHNVKITLNTTKAPDVDDIARTMEEVLGRPCGVHSDGGRITVTVGQGTRAA